MFSSLPSASKIYLSSTKQKQKNINSAKKKRKKITANTCTPVHVNDEETLVSSTSLQDFSASHISLNSHRESLEIEVNCDKDNEHVIIEDISKEESFEYLVENKSAKLNTVEGSINSRSERVKSSRSDRIKSVSCKHTDQRTERENTAALLLDSPSHKCSETNTEQNGETLKNTDVVSDIEDSTNVFRDDQLFHKDETNIKILGDKLENNFSEEVNSSLPFTQLANGDSPELQVENLSTDVCENIENLNNSAIIPKIEVEIELNQVSDTMVNNTEVNSECNKLDLNATSGECELSYEKNETLVEPSSIDVSERKDYLGENITSDILDSSSVRSDCCTSTNIYDIHVDSSDHSSTDENQVSPGDNCRMQSPQQSEVSCTESIMYDKFACQSESSLLSNSVSKELLNKDDILSFKENSVTKEIGEAYEISNSSEKGKFKLYSLRKRVFDTSYSLINLQKQKSAEKLKRSLSLPEKINCCRRSEQINYVWSSIIKSLGIDNSIVDKSKNGANKCYSTSDKSTLTADEFNFTSNKSTITSDIVDSSKCKKDVATTPIKEKHFHRENKSIATSFRDNTKSIMKVLPPVGVMQARARSYVFGSIGATGSLLGNEELSRLFPDSKVTIFIGTWNMNGHDPPESIDDFLLPLDVSSVPDIYAIGVQESMQSRSEWEILLQTTLGPSHVLFASTSFGVLHLSIFMRRDLIWFCSEPEESNIATRPGSMIKTKGAVAICFMFFGTSFLFVNSHLTAHEQKLKERLSDYEKICSALDLPRQIPLKSYQKGKDVTSRFDCVFWSGDLNFRVVQDRPSVLSFVEERIRKPEPCGNLLMKHDQLCQAMAKGKAFHGFKEGVINFIPSYKFDVGTSSFDSTKQRVPSYTDRILYRCREKSSIVCMHYNAVPGIFTSDHKPVFAVFNVSIKPGRDNIPLAAGLFKREIYIEAIKRRAQQLGVDRNHKQSTICAIM